MDTGKLRDSLHAIWTWVWVGGATILWWALVFQCSSTDHPYWEEDTDGTKEAPVPGILDHIGERSSQEIAFGDVSLTPEAIEDYIGGPTTAQVLEQIKRYVPESTVDEIMRRYRAMPKDRPVFEHADVSEEMFDRWIEANMVAWSLQLYGQNINRWHIDRPLPGPRFELHHFNPTHLLLNEAIEREIRIEMTVIWLRNHL